MCLVRVVNAVKNFIRTIFYFYLFIIIKGWSISDYIRRCFVADLKSGISIMPTFTPNNVNTKCAALPFKAEFATDTKITEIERFHCKKCSKSYKNKRHLYRHEKEECVDVQPRFRCPVCFNMFRRKYHLSRHFLNKHGFDDAFV